LIATADLLRIAGIRNAGQIRLRKAAVVGLPPRALFALVIRVRRATLSLRPASLTAPETAASVAAAVSTAPETSAAKSATAKPTASSSPAAARRATTGVGRTLSSAGASAVRRRIKLRKGRNVQRQERRLLVVTRQTKIARALYEPELRRFNVVVTGRQRGQAEFPRGIGPSRPRFICIGISDANRCAGNSNSGCSSHESAERNRLSGRVRAALRIRLLRG